MKINSVSLINRERESKRQEIKVWHRRITHPELGEFDQVTFLLGNKHKGYEGKVFVRDSKRNIASSISFDELWDNGERKLFAFRLETNKDYENIGLAKQILSELTHVAKRIGSEAIVLEVSKHNTKAFKIYKSLGFSQTKSLFGADVMEKAV